MAGIVDVAKRAGVSQATVSRVIGGQTFVSDDARERVLAAINDLGYVPNSLGKALRTGRSQTVALIVSDIEQGWHAALSKEMQRRLAMAGLDMLLFDLGHSQQRLKDLMSRAITLRLKCVVLAATDVFEWDTVMPELNEFRAQGGSVVSVGQRLEHLGICSIVQDDCSASAEAVKFLAGQGRHRIAYINRIAHSAIGQERYKGYLAGLNAAGLDFRAELVKDIRFFRYEGGFEAASELLRQGDAFDAILAGTDEQAIGVMAALKDHGRRIPEDVAVIGFGGLDIGKFQRPALSSYRGDLDKMVDCTVEAIRGERDGLTLISRELVARRST